MDTIRDQIIAVLQQILDTTDEETIYDDVFVLIQEVDTLIERNWDYMPAEALDAYKRLNTAMYDAKGSMFAVIEEIEDLIDALDV